MLHLQQCPLTLSEVRFPNMTTGRLPSIEGGIQPTIVDAKGDLIAATAADTPARLAVGANDTILTADSSEATGLKWATPASSSPTSASATVATSQTTSSGSYTDLTTPGPAVTVTTGTKALVIISDYSVVGVGDNAFTSFAVSGATTIAAADAYAISQSGTNTQSVSRATRLSTLTAGSNTFTMKYRGSGGGTGTFKDREIIVIDLGS